MDVRPAGSRFTTENMWLSSRHSFSFGPHYEPDNTHFGLLLVNNDVVVAPGAGFDTHPHRDMEIVTWVVSGSLVHQDSEGNTGLVYPGLAQRMSAGSGILHSERNDALPEPNAATGASPVRPSQPVRFVQMWVSPDERGLTPGYEQVEIDDRLLSGELVPVASGLAKHRHDSAVRIHQKDAGLAAARLAAGASVPMPAAPYVHLFIVQGSVLLEGYGVLSTGDSVRLTGGDGQRVSATRRAEILVWEMHSALG
jgi:redox-sensitive bicupin YhaK (pirin superfamily)